MAPEPAEVDALADAAPVGGVGPGVDGSVEGSVEGFAEGSAEGSVDGDMNAGARRGMTPVALLLVVALAGGATMVVELGAVRLLAPWFGASSSVWTNVIGVVLAALAVGYTLGARFASGPTPLARLGAVLLLGSMLAATLPAMTPVVAGLFMPDGVALAGASRLLVWGSLASALVLFLPIAACLGCACPLAVESLQRQRGDAAGHAGGHVLAASTLGSLGGTFGTTHLFVPVLGTTWTFLTAGLVLFTCGLVVRSTARRSAETRGAGGLVGLVLAFGATATASAVSGATRAPGAPGELTLAQAESAYQSLRVTETGEGDARLRKLQVNESLDSFQSVWAPNPGLLPGGFYYNHFALPYGWSTREQGAPPSDWAVFIVGLGGGSAVRVLEGIIAPETNLAVTGVELDPTVVELAVEHFELDTTSPGRTVVGGLDGRVALVLETGSYDQVIVDAYANNMEVPPHLASIEAFELIHHRLRDGGWLTVNVGGFGVDDPVVQGIAGAIVEAFGAPVSIFRVPFSRNLTLHARRGGDVPTPATRPFGSLGAPLIGGLGDLLPPLELEGAWQVVAPGMTTSELRDQRSNLEALQARSIAAAEARVEALNRRGEAPVRLAVAAARPEDASRIAASTSLARRGDLLGASEAAEVVADPVSAAYLRAYLVWAGGDPQGALEAAEIAMAEHGADLALLGLVVDLALVVGADRLAGARLRDLQAAASAEGMGRLAEGTLERLVIEVDRAASRGAVASAALSRAKITASAAGVLLALALLGVWRFARSGSSRRPMVASRLRSEVAV